MKMHIITVKGEVVFPSVAEEIQKELYNLKKESKEYRILYLSSFDEELKKCVCYMTEHVRIPGIKIRTFHRREYVFEEPYKRILKDGSTETFSQKVTDVIARNYSLYDIFFLLSKKSIPSEQTENLSQKITEGIQKDQRWISYLLEKVGPQKIPSHT